MVRKLRNGTLATGLVMVACIVGGCMTLSADFGEIIWNFNGDEETANAVLPIYRSDFSKMIVVVDGDNGLHRETLVSADDGLAGGIIILALPIDQAYDFTVYGIGPFHQRTLITSFHSNPADSPGYPNGDDGNDNGGGNGGGGNGGGTSGDLELVGGSCGLPACSDGSPTICGGKDVSFDAPGPGTLLITFQDDFQIEYRITKAGDFIFLWGDMEMFPLLAGPYAAGYAEVKFVGDDGTVLTANPCYK